MKVLKVIAAILALFIGVMSVFAGSMVLLGVDTKEYNVLVWLVSYNVIFGGLSILAAYYIWKGLKKGKYLTLFILAMHFSVFIYLKFFNDFVALESIKAMIFRTNIWVVIIVLSMLIPKYFIKQQN